MRIKAEGIKVDLGLNEGGRVQKFLVDSCANHMDKYVPMDTGALSGNILKTNHSVIYTVPYATYQYFGVSKNGKPLKYSKEKHAYAGPYWDKRMKSAELQDVIAEVQERMSRGE